MMIKHARRRSVEELTDSQNCFIGTLQEICNKVIIKDPTTPQMPRHIVFSSSLNHH